MNIDDVPEATWQQIEHLSRVIVAQALALSGCNCAVQIAFERQVEPLPHMAAFVEHQDNCRVAMLAHAPMN